MGADSSAGAARAANDGKTYSEMRKSRMAAFKTASELPATTNSFGKTSDWETIGIFGDPVKTPTRGCLRGSLRLQGTFKATDDLRKDHVDDHEDATEGSQPENQ